MKTPEQIADEHIWRITDAPDDARGREWVRNQIITAIEADRAQRKVVNWNEAEQLLQAYDAAGDVRDSGETEREMAREVVDWVASALAGGAR